MPYVFIALALLTSVTSFASEWDFTIKPVSTIGINYGYDGDKNQNYNVYLDLEFPTHQQLMLAYSRSHSAIDDSIARYYHLLISTSPYKTMSLDAGLSYNNLANSLKNYTLNSTANLNFENWHFSISPQLSAITFFLNSDNNNTLGISAKGIDVSGSYFGFVPYYIFSRYFQNRFSGKPLFLQSSTPNTINLSAVNSIRILSKINNLRSNLEEKRLSVTLGRYFSWGSLDFTYDYTQLFNAAQWLNFSTREERSSTNTVQTYYSTANISVNKHFSTGLTLGWQAFSTDTNRLIFGSAELNYHW